MRININRRFPVKKWSVITRGVMPKSWDDRWAIEASGDHIVCTRTRTNQVVYRLSFREVSEKDRLLYAVIDYADAYLEHINEDLHNESALRETINTLLDEIVDSETFLK